MKKSIFLLVAFCCAMMLNAATITVAPGSGTIKSAISSASAGDVLVLQTGTYTEPGSYTVSVPLTIMAGDGQTPVVMAGSHITLAASLTCKGITFDANGVGDYFLAANGANAKNIVLENCEVANYIKYMIVIDATHHVDSCIINNCYFHGGKRALIYTYSSTLPDNVPGCYYFEMKNSTVANMGSYSGVGTVDIRNNTSDQSTTATKVVMDHVTFYNFSNEYGALYVGGSTQNTVTNSIFMNPAGGAKKYRAVYAGGGQVSHSMFCNVDNKPVTFTDTLNRDPLFVNPGAGDFTFQKTSPAIGIASDGSNLGDPRWGVQGNSLSFTMGQPTVDVTIYDPGYTFSWSANDPTGTATVTLEYSTDGDAWTTIASGLAPDAYSYQWTMEGVPYATYQVRGTLIANTSITDVAKGKIIYKELIPTIYYVSLTGSDSNDGLSWATAKRTIGAAVEDAVLGDTVKVAAGTYNEYISIKDGVQLFGSYTPATGLQDVDNTPSVLDGTDLGHYLLVKYDNPCTRETRINGFIVENADHASDGGGGYLRANCILENCIVRNNTTTASGGGMYSAGAIIRDCLFELNYADGAGGAIAGKGGLIENCIFRGNQGKYATVRSEDGCIVRNCLFYNNEPSNDEWPASGGVYNPSGTVYNCTFANNYGAMYAGSHSDNILYNCLFWGNQCEDGFADPSTYVSGSSTAWGSGNNAGDSFFEAQNFTLTLGANNTAANGPHFAAPTSFVGAPKTAGQIAAMRAADFSLTAGSPVMDKGRSEGAPDTDIEGTARPKGSGIDLGCYEYDPNAPVIAVQGVRLNMDTLRMVVEEENGFAPIFTPSKVTNRHVTWTVENPAIVSCDANGVLLGLAVGETKVSIVTQDGEFKDTAVVVVSPKPVIIIHPEVLKYDTLYPMADYTVPSFVSFWCAKEAARKDSTPENLQAMRAAALTLAGKEEPYCLVANINGDPKTRMAFNWFTNEGITAGEVQLVAQAGATAADFEGQGVITVPATATKTKKLNYAVSSSGIIKATGMDKKTGYYYIAHKALAENLQPGTTYCYRVGYAGHWSAIATFQTAAAVQGEYSFAYMSDSHIMNQEYVDYARWCAETLVKNEPDVKFCLFPGDFVETGTKSNSEWEWERWFEESMRPALYKMPFVPTDGNHDDTELLNYDWHFNTDNAFNKRSLIVKPQFQGITYSFVYGDVLFLVYSMQDYWREDDERDRISENTSAYLKTDIGNWFREQVAAHPECKYRVTLCHKNVFSGSGHQEDVETPLFRSMMLPIFKDCEIDLAIQGHDHCYEVMGPVNPDTREPIASAISGVEQVAVNTNTNMTGLSGGTFTVDDGTLYFIGATCGRKRYYPYTREEMDAQIDKHKVTNYFDLFTSRFGQPGAPSYTKFTVKADGLYLDTYSADSEGTATPFNSIKVVRTREHTALTAVPEVVNYESIGVQKIFRNGRLYIVQHDHIYSALGF